MSRALLLKRPSPLAFPIGNPGFDPSHIASGGKPMFSGVAAGSNFVDLFNGKKGNVNPTPSSVIDANIGPSLVTTAAGFIDYSGILPIESLPTLAVTQAAIFKIGTNASDGAIMNYGGTNGVSLTTSSGGVLDANWMGSTTLASTITLSLGVPYFAVASSLSATGTNFVVVNLTNGQTNSHFTSTASTMLQPNSEVAIGQSIQTGVNFVGSIAAAMTSYGYLSIPQLLQWAQDPWAFWYPRTLDLSMMLSGPSGAPIVIGQPSGFLFAPVGGPARRLRSPQAFPPQVTQIMLSARAAVAARASAGSSSASSLSSRTSVAAQSSAMSTSAASLSANTAIQTKARANSTSMVALTAMAVIQSTVKSAASAAGSLTGFAFGKVFGAGGVSTSSAPPLGPQQGFQQGFLFKPGAGPSWDIRRRAAFPPQINAVSLFATAFVAARASAAQSATSALSGKTAVQAKASSQPSPTAALAALAAVKIKAAAFATGKVALAGATMIAAVARLVPPGAIALVASAFIKLTGRAATPQMTAAMSAKAALNVKAAAAPPTGKTALTASAKIMAAARAGATGFAPIIGFLATTLIRLSGRGLLASFRSSPRSADAPAEDRSADAPPNT